MLETHNEQFDLAATDLAGLGSKAAPDAMGRIHNKIIFLESCFDLLRHSLFPAWIGWRGRSLDVPDRVLLATNWPQALSPDVRAKTTLPRDRITPQALWNEVRTMLTDIVTSL